MDTRLPLEKFRESVTAETLKDAPSVTEVGFFLPGYQVVRFEGELGTNRLGLEARANNILVAAFRILV